MSNPFAKPKIQAPTPAAAPIAQGADALKVGDDSPLTRTRGGLGRLALRVGKPADGGM